MGLNNVWILKTYLPKKKKQILGIEFTTKNNNFFLEKLRNYTSNGAYNINLNIWYKFNKI